MTLQWRCCMRKRQEQDGLLKAKSFCNLARLPALWILQPLNLMCVCVCVCPSVHRCICVGKKNQVDATEWFIALIICSTCFGHFYAHHQELATMCVLLPPMVRSAWLLVVGGLGAEQQGLCVQKSDVARRQSCNITIGGNNTHIVSSSWWWA